MGFIADTEEMAIKRQADNCTWLQDGLKLESFIRELSGENTFTLSRRANAGCELRPVLCPLTIFREIPLERASYFRNHHMICTVYV